jgi:hypothetical protein
MNSPITNFELGKMLHREYEAEASRYWGQAGSGEEKPGRSKVYGLGFAFAGAVLTVVLLGQMLPI